MKAEFELRKIANGYILRINGEETFFDVPEAVCGRTSEWVLEACRRLDDPRPDLHAQMAQAQLTKHIDRLVKFETIEDDYKHHLADAFKYMTDIFRRK